MSTDAELLIAKAAIYPALAAVAGTIAGETDAALAAIFDPGCAWRVAHPINHLDGNDAAIEHLWLPVKEALPDLERRDTIFVGGRYQDRLYVAAVGHYCGTFRNDWLGIPATGRPVFVRYGEVYEVRDGRIVQANLLWDILDVIRQAGHWPLAPSLGVEGMWPGPLTGDGIVLGPTDPEVSAENLAQTLAMHQTLADYNRQDVEGRDGLLAMPQKAHWHPKMMWYGPSGIGTTRGLAGFVDDHQLPWRRAFPSRSHGAKWDEIADMKARHGGGHYIRIGDGDFSVTGGWPSVYAVHAGGDLFGMPASGKGLTMRVMDFYLHHEGLIRENWVPIDVLDLILQMGVDVLDRLQHQIRPASMPKQRL